MSIIILLLLLLLLPTTKRRALNFVHFFLDHSVHVKSKLYVTTIVNNEHPELIVTTTTVLYTCKLRFKRVPAMKRRGAYEICFTRRAQVFLTNFLTYYFLR